MDAPLHALAASPAFHTLALAGLCAAYVQGGIDKLRDFPGAVAEVRSLGLAPAGPLAAATVVLQLGASAMVLTGWHRSAGALALALFTAFAASRADRFWRVPRSQAAERRRVANAFFEHLGLVGGWLLVAWIDLGGLDA